MSLTLATKGVISPSPGLSMATKGVLWRQLEGILSSLISADSSLTDIELLIQRSLMMQATGSSSTSNIELEILITAIELAAAIAADSSTPEIELLISRLMDAAVQAASGTSTVDLEGVAEVLGLILNPLITSVTPDREIVHLPYEIKPYP
jgi:hypothetical protein